MLYGPIVFNAKLSLFLLYYRLFVQHKWMRNWIYLDIDITALLYSSSTVVYGYLCIPRREQSWFDAVLSSRCHKQYVMLDYVRSPFNLFNDIFYSSYRYPPYGNYKCRYEKNWNYGDLFDWFFVGDTIHSHWRNANWMSSACIANFFDMYFRIQPYKSPDITWNLIPVVATV